jgi:hypothetical protein
MSIGMSWDDWDLLVGSSLDDWDLWMGMNLDDRGLWIDIHDSNMQNSSLFDYGFFVWIMVEHLNWNWEVVNDSMAVIFLPLDITILLKWNDHGILTFWKFYKVLFSKILIFLSHYKGVGADD